MEPWLAAMAKPMIVGDVHEYVWIVLHQLTHVARKDIFIADCNADSYAIPVQDARFFAWAHITGVGEPVPQVGEIGFQRKIFAEHEQPILADCSKHSTEMADQESGVVPPWLGIADSFFDASASENRRRFHGDPFWECGSVP